MSGEAERTHGVVPENGQAREVSPGEGRAEEAAFRWANYVGPSAQMREIGSLLESVAKSGCPVLIEGPTGAGKEVVARTIHGNSHRASKPFVEVNCAAIPGELIESELFGHERGAFTSATASRKGKFVAAHGGTLFLDEIGDMGESVQAKILRALSEERVTPVGSEGTYRTDIRLIAATNKDLPGLIQKGKFRDDLFYRLGALKVRVPPLSERPEDIVPLVERHLRNRECSEKLSPEARALLVAYPWPGNVRELYAVVDAALALAARNGNGRELLAEKLDAVLKMRKLSSRDAASPPGMQSWREFERSYFEGLTRNCATVVEMSLVSGIPQTTLYRKFKEFGLTTPQRIRKAKGKTMGEG